MRKYYIEVDGELFEVKNAKEASDLLDSIVELAGEENVEIEIIEPPRITIKTANNKPTKHKKLLAKVDKVNQVYQARMEKIKKQRKIDMEISERLLKKIAKEDDDNIILSLLI